MVTVLGEVLNLIEFLLVSLCFCSKHDQSSWGGGRGPGEASSRLSEVETIEKKSEREKQLGMRTKASPPSFFSLTHPLFYAPPQPPKAAWNRLGLVLTTKSVFSQLCLLFIYIQTYYNSFPCLIKDRRSAANKSKIRFVLFRDKISQ